MAKALIVEILADAKQFTAELDRAAGKTRQMSKVAGVAGVALAGGLAYGLEKSAEAAMASQVSTSRMEAAFKASGQTADKFSKQISKAEDASRNLGFSNTDVRDSLGSLEIATHSGTKAIQDLAVAEDIARFKHVDLTSASKMLTMAMAGSQRAAKQLGLSVQAVTQSEDDVKKAFKNHTSEAYKLAMANAKLIDKQKTAAEVIELVKTKLHGQAQAFSETAAGGMAKFHAQTEALQENIGTALLPAINKLVSVLAVAAGWLTKHSTVAKILVGVLATLAVGLMAVSAATAIWTAATTVAAAATAVLGLAITALPFVAIAAVIGIAAYEIIKHWTPIKGFFIGLWSDVTHVFQAAISWLQGHWKVFLGLPGLVWQYWGQISGFFGKLWSGITGAFSRAIGWIKSAWTAMVGWLRTMIQPLIDIYNALFGSGQSMATHGKVAHVGPGGYNGPTSAHAAGGIFKQPHFAMIAERGPEAVIPLSNGRVAGGSPLSFGRGGGSTVNVGPITVNGTADAAFATRLAEELSTQLRGGRVPAFQQAIAAV